MRTAIALLALLLVAAPAGPAAAQEGPPPPDTSAFEGWEQWPLIVPDNLDLDTGALSNQRVVFDGVFGPPGSARPVTMYMDVFEHWFGERPSFWIQWTSSGNPTGLPEAMGIDALIVDRSDLRILFRIATVGEGVYGLTRHGEDETEHYRIDLGGDTATPHHLEGGHPAFDFAAFQFLFPFLELEEGSAFRIPNIGQPPDLLPRELAVRVAGKIDLETAQGEQVEVWDVQVVPAHRRSIIHFYVTQEAPFFYGWDYLIPSGNATTMRLYDWQPMLARTPPGEPAGD